MTTTTRTLEVGGRTRSYLLHVPPSYDATPPLPPALPFHDADTNDRLMAPLRGSGMERRAEGAGLLPYVPAGAGLAQPRPRLRVRLLPRRPGPAQHLRQGLPFGRADRPGVGAPQRLPRDAGRH